MPLQKRLPKYGFYLRISRTTAQVRLGELNNVEGSIGRSGGAQGCRPCQREYRQGAHIPVR